MATASATAAASVLPSGYAEPIETVTANNHTAWVSIAAALGLCFIGFFLILRVYIRIHLKAQFGPDDIVMIVATVFAVVQAALVFIEVSHGFGKSIDLLGGSALVDIQKAAYASDIFYLLALWLSKCSVIVLFIRMTPDRNHLRALKGILGFSSVWAIVSILMVALRCNLAHPWIQYGAQCTNLFVRWQLITAFDIIVEVCLFAAIILLVARLQMPWQPKFTVMMGFAFRLPVIALAAVRLHYINVEILSANPTLAGVPAAILTQVHLSYSLIAATIPCMNPFIEAVSTKLGAIGPQTVLVETQAFSSKKSASNEGSKDNHNYGLRSILSDKRQATKSKDAAKQAQTQSSAENIPITDPQIYRGDYARSNAGVTCGGKVDSESIGSNDSTKKMIIRKDIQWTVENGSENSLSHRATPW